MTRVRRDVCLTWAGADLTGSPLSAALGRLAMRFRVLALCGVRPALRLNDGAGELASRVVFARYGPEAGFSVIDALLEVGSESSFAPASPNGSGRGMNGAGRAPLNGSSDVQGPALARALIERNARDSGNGVPRSSNGADPEREPPREPVSPSSRG